MIKDSNVTVRVADLKQAIRFYTETLGLGLKFHIENEWAEIQAPGLTIGLNPVGHPGTRAGHAESVVITFMVDSLLSTMALLQDKGAKFSPQIDEDKRVRLAYFYDLDNNMLCLCEVKPHAAKAH